MIDLELTTQIDMAMRSAEPAHAFRALAEIETTRAAAIIPNTKAAAYERGEAMGRAKAFIACSRVDERPTADGCELVIG